jgi:hypothetical protein
MKTNQGDEIKSTKTLQDEINSLKERVQSLENLFNKKSSDDSGSLYQNFRQDEYNLSFNGESGANWFESKLGEIGLGLLGNIVLLFSIIFLMSFTQDLEYRFLPTIIGFVAVIGTLVFSMYYAESYPTLTKMLSTSGLLLAYYVILKMHFFTEDPLIASGGFVILLLFIPIGLQLYNTIKNRQELGACIAITLILLSSVFYNTIHTSLFLIVVAAAISLYFFIRYSWWRFLILSIFMVYIVHSIWLWNNPIMNGTAELRSYHHYNVIYLFIYGSIFSSTLVFKIKDSIKNSIFISITLINAFCFSLVLLSNVLAYFEENYTLIFILISFYCLLFSIIIKSREVKLFVPAFYACFGFMALSVAVFGFFGFPDTYLVLALQSLLVVSTALWFRSKIIVVTNTMLFLGILLTYLFIEESLSTINYTIVFVSLISARLLNWKKERLTLQTEILRNIYLFSALSILLYALYGSLPGKFITISWIAASGLFFLLSVILKNVKYRWLGFIGIFATVVYLLMVDLAQMDVVYRIVVFLFLAILSISISVYYTRRIKKKASS